MVPDVSQCAGGEEAEPRLLGSSTALAGSASGTAPSPAQALLVPPWAHEGLWLLPPGF